MHSGMSGFVCLHRTLIRSDFFDISNNVASSPANGWYSASGSESHEPQDSVSVIWSRENVGSMVLKRSKKLRGFELPSSAHRSSLSPESSASSGKVERSVSRVPAQSKWNCWLHPLFLG